MIGPESRFYDVTDFAFGLGWPCLVAAIAGMLALRRHGWARRVAFTGVALVATLALGRLLPTETARTWIFLGPLLTPVAGAWISRGSLDERILYFVAAACAIAATAHRVAFVDG